MKLIGRQLAVSLLVAALPLTAAQADSPPEGIEAGKWVLSPYWKTSLEYDDNVFKRPDQGGVSDLIYRLIFGMKATMPIGNSLFQLDYEGDQRKYQDYAFARDLAQRARAGLVLNSSRGDRFKIEDSYTLGITDVQTIDEGGELIFQGEPFAMNVAEFAVAREVRAMQGYSINVKHIDLEFDSDTVAFFNYRGFESAFEYRQPLPLNNWLIVHHTSRRLNHYDPRRGNLFYRAENSAAYQIGMRGHIGGRHPYDIRAGWGIFRYKGPEAGGSDFKGAVGLANIRFLLSSRSILGVSLDRRPLPSFYNTYYIINVLRVRLERKWPRGSSAGLSAVYSRNKYGDPLVGVCGGDAAVSRVDQRLMLDVDAEWMFHDLAGLRLSASRWQRDSNCELTDYEANVISAGVVLGWD